MARSGEMSNRGGGRCAGGPHSVRTLRRSACPQPATTGIEALEGEAVGAVREIAPLADRRGGDVVHPVTVDLDLEA